MIFKDKIKKLITEKNDMEDLIKAQKELLIKTRGKEYYILSNFQMIF